MSPKHIWDLYIAITSSPHFNVDDSVALLHDSTRRFRCWLETDCTISAACLPSVSRETNITLKRIELVKISGNICRHNILRSVGIAEDVRELLAQNGIAIALDQALLVLSALHTELFDNAFEYHSSTIAEFLNDLRWGIYEYLKPEYRNSIVHKEPPGYQYTYPKDVCSDFAKECYWELMNGVRERPYMRRFLVTEYLKKRY